MWGCSTKQRRARARGGRERRFPRRPRVLRTWNVKVWIAGVEYYPPTTFTLMAEER